MSDYDFGPRTMNRTQYVMGQKGGMYESFYQRANHPTEPRAFWIRYTLFAPKGRPEAAIGELWSIYFDGITGEHVVAKEEHPLATCAFERWGFGARVGDSVLEPGLLKGGAAGPADTVAWDLRYTESGQPPVYLLPRNLYKGGFPKAKNLVGYPNAVYSGQLTVNGRDVDVNGWVGSQCHNWGSRHTDHYAFGQVCGFDEDPEGFLEIVTAKATLVGPVKSPMVTFLVLREGGREHSLVSLPQALRATGSFRYFEWVFSSENDDVQVKGYINAPKSAFVGLNYYNPPGGIKHCLNTKIGSCRLEVTDKRTSARRTLTTSNRTLFEILTDDRDHGVPIRA